MRWTEEEYAAYEARRRKDTSSDPPSAAHLPLKGKASKYHNQRVEIDGKKFDSKHEAEVYGELMLRQRAGELKLVLRQVPFELPDHPEKPGIHQQKEADGLRVGHRDQGGIMGESERHYNKTD